MNVLIPMVVVIKHALILLEVSLVDVMMDMSLSMKHFVLVSVSMI